MAVAARLPVAALVLLAFPAAQSLAQLAAKERSGEQIVQVQCSKCHEAGLEGAPRIADREAWVPRMKLGVDAVVMSAIRGHGRMPARGGMAELTDREIRSAVLYMFNPAGTAVTAAASPPAAADPHRKVIEGTEILLGVVSVESLRAKTTAAEAERKMHGGMPRGSAYYHVNITLHDVASKAEIADAQVSARVATPLGGDTKKLELMRVKDAVSYGNYFRMAGRETYTITVQFSRPGDGRQFETSFDFRR